MSGINSFLDYDASRNHTRGGFGLEYSRDYLKLSTNSYFSLSGWKNSPDKEDYEERPASGWAFVQKVTFLRGQISTAN